MKRFALPIIIFLFCCVNIFAQQMKTYTWGNGGFSFQVPVSMQVKEDTETSYEVDGDVLVVNIQLLEDPDTNLNAIRKTVKEMAGDIGITDITSPENLKLKTGLLGTFVEGVMDEANASMAVILDLKRKTEICVTVVFDDGMEDAAIRVLSSFTKK